MCEYLAVDNQDAHRAIHDVNAMIQIYLKITDFDLYPAELSTLMKKHKKLTYKKGMPN